MATVLKLSIFDFCELDFELDAISSTEPLDEIVQQRCLVYSLAVRLRAPIIAASYNNACRQTKRIYRRSDSD